MGWFKKIFKKKKGGTKVGNFFRHVFKKKKGGTKVGNFLRGVFNKTSNGRFGNGEVLAERNARKQGRKPNTNDYRKSSNSLKRNGDFRNGQNFSDRSGSTKYGNNFINKIESSPRYQVSKQREILNTLKKYKYIVGGVLLTSFTGIYFTFFKSKKRKIK